MQCKFTNRIFNCCFSSICKRTKGALAISKSLNALLALLPRGKELVAGERVLLSQSHGFKWKEVTLVLHIPRWEEKIPLAKTTLEKTWLFHEIGRCYLELDQPWQAQHYGEKSQQCAEEEGDIEWQLNASVLVAQAQGMGMEREDSPHTTFPRPLAEGTDEGWGHLSSQCVPGQMNVAPESGG